MILAKSMAKSLNDLNEKRLRTAHKASASIAPHKWLECSKLPQQGNVIEQFWRTIWYVLHIQGHLFLSSTSQDHCGGLSWQESWSHQADSKHFLPIILHQPPLVLTNVLKKNWLKHLLFLFFRLRKCGRSIGYYSKNRDIYFSHPHLKTTVEGYHGKNREVIARLEWETARDSA